MNYKIGYIIILLFSFRIHSGGNEWKSCYTLWSFLKKPFVGQENNNVYTDVLDAVYQDNLTVEKCIHHVTQEREEEKRNEYLKTAAITVGKQKEINKLTKQAHDLQAANEFSVYGVRCGEGIDRSMCRDTKSLLGAVGILQKTIIPCFGFNQTMLLLQRNYKTDSGYVYNHTKKKIEPFIVLQRNVSGAIATGLFLHELGHLRLGHQLLDMNIYQQHFSEANEKDGKTSQALAKLSRAEERSADLWYAAHSSSYAQSVKNALSYTMQNVHHTNEKEKHNRHDMFQEHHSLNKRLSWATTLYNIKVAEEAYIKKSQTYKS